ncbi:unnamed protein product [Cylindrotheca closterium]|uniref:Uncharacterized protein n=1 Tax=Cylindrotheca closterium TaxID=2856 RepID=A0AAD2CXI3_9STRA|nr:unnamed protein product [Cylindrotheca closterium]
MAHELAQSIVIAAQTLKLEEEGITVAGMLYTTGEKSGTLTLRDYNQGDKKVFYDYFEVLQEAKARGLVPIEEEIAEKIMQKANRAHSSAGVSKNVLAVFKNSTNSVKINKKTEA